MYTVADVNQLRGVLAIEPTSFKQVYLASNGDYVLSGDLVVPLNTTLVFGAGVRFAASASSRLTVGGSIVADLTAYIFQIYGANGAILTVNLASQQPREISVAWWGAGRAVVSDADAISEALRSVGGRRAVTVVFPGGTYLLDRPVPLLEGRTYDGRSATLAPSAEFSGESLLVATNEHQRGVLRITGFRVIGRPADLVLLQLGATDADAVTVEVEGCWFSGARMAISGRSSVAASIRRCVIEDMEVPFEFTVGSGAVRAAGVSVRDGRDKTRRALFTLTEVDSEVALMDCQMDTGLTLVVQGGRVNVRGCDLGPCRIEAAGGKVTVVDSVIHGEEGPLRGPALSVVDAREVRVQGSLILGSGVESAAVEIQWSTQEEGRASLVDCRVSVPAVESVSSIQHEAILCVDTTGLFSNHLLLQDVVIDAPFSYALRLIGGVATCQRCLFRTDAILLVEQELPFAQFVYLRQVHWEPSPSASPRYARFRAADGSPLRLIISQEGVVVPESHNRFDLVGGARLEDVYTFGWRTIEASTDDPLTPGRAPGLEGDVYRPHPRIPEGDLGDSKPSTEWIRVRSGDGLTGADDARTESEPPWKPFCPPEVVSS